MKLLCIAFSFVIFNLTHSAEILSLSFESTGGYTTSITEFTDSGSDYFLRTDGSHMSGVSLNNTDGFYFAAQDIDGEGAVLPVSLEINNISIEGYTNLVFSLYVAEDDDGSNQDWDASDYVHIDYDMDNSGDFSNLIHIESELTSGTNGEPRIDSDYDGVGDGTAITNTFTQFSQAIPSSGSELDIKITFFLNSGDEDIALDNILLTGDDSSLPVELTFFKGVSKAGHIELSWRTESEIDNLGFVLYRSHRDVEEAVSSYKDNVSLRGQGSATHGTNYTYSDKAVHPGERYIYVLADVDYNGIETRHMPVVVMANSKGISMKRPYPNPFNPATSIQISVGSPQVVQVDVITILGEEIRTLMNDVMPSGDHTIHWDGNKEEGMPAPSGVYFLRMRTENTQQIQKVVLTR